MSVGEVQEDCVEEWLECEYQYLDDGGGDEYLWGELFV